MIYFSSHIRGHFAFTFCRYFHQNLKVIPSDLEGKNSIFFRRSFFPRYALGMPSFNNSVIFNGFIFKN